jgi:hypothetical protein
MAKTWRRLPTKSRQQLSDERLKYISRLCFEIGSQFWLTGWALLIVSSGPPFQNRTYWNSSVLFWDKRKHCFQMLLTVYCVSFGRWTLFKYYRKSEINAAVKEPTTRTALLQFENMCHCTAAVWETVPLLQFEKLCHCCCLTTWYWCSLGNCHCFYTR